VSNFQTRELGKTAVKGKKYVKMSSALRRPTEDDVRTLAYQIFEANGRLEDHADQDWFQAEQELLGLNKSA
jgi:hypothetical protein